MIGWSVISWWLEVLQRAKIESCSDEDCREDRPHDPDPEEEKPDEIPEDVELGDLDRGEQPWALGRVGAWVGAGSFRTNSGATATLDFAAKLGLGRLDVICNDHSAKRKPQSFGTWNKSRLETFCRMAVDRGFEVHLMTWCMPHDVYLNGMVEQMSELYAKCRASSVQLDAEEPWTNARRPLPYDDAAKIVIDGFGRENVPYGVTGIGWASSKKLGPLMAGAAYGVPQCYSTARNNLNPKTSTSFLVGLWRKRFPRPPENPLPLVIGLAGYRQSGRPGYTKERFMTAAFDGALAVEPVDIVYWSMRWIRKYRSTANLIRKFTEQASARAGTGDVA